MSTNASADGHDEESLGDWDEAKAELALIKAQVKEMQDQLEVDAVKMKTKTFRSQANIHAWLTLNGVEPFFFCFVDPMLLLSIMDWMQMTEADATKD